MKIDRKSQRVTNENSLLIPTPTEFDFSQNIDYLSRSADECMYEISDQRIYRALAIDSETVIIEISADSNENLLIRFLEQSIPENAYMRQKVCAFIEQWFDLHTDLLPFYELAENDPILSKPVNQFWGLRNMGIPDLFEALIWGIIGQQIQLSFAYKLKKRLVQTYGRRLEHDGVSFWLFPRPEDLARITVEELADMKMTRRKGEYIIEVAKLFTRGELSKEKLLQAKDIKTAEKMLTNIRGIGPWTANYVFMRCLRFPNAFPIADVGLHHAIKLVLGTTKKPSIEEIRTLSKRWTNWEAYATFYLWRLLY